MKPSDAVSRRAFALLVGASATTIDRMAQRRELPANKEGRIPVAKGIKAYVAVRLAPSEQLDQVAEQQRASLRAAEVRERLAKAEARELELAKERGDLVEVALVREDAQATIEVTRSRLLALPSRVALQLEALNAKTSGRPSAAELEALLADEVSDLLARLHRSRFVKAADGSRSWVCGKCAS